MTAPKRSGASRTKVVLVAALTTAVLGGAGLAALALPAGAGGQPSLPEISAEELVSSALSARPPAMAGTIHMKNALGLPPLPGLPRQAFNGESDVRVWFDGDRRGRISLPSNGGEQTLVYDGTTLWRWDSATRTVTKTTKPAQASADKSRPDGQFDPARVASQVLGLIRPSSNIVVDGTASVADRPAYELVLSPLATERTLLREVRVAIDAQTRIPLRLQLMANGSTDPVLSIGFDQFSVGAQDPALFQFSPPEGAKVVEQQPDAAKPGGNLLAEAQPKIVGDGWDIVVVVQLPAGALAGPGQRGEPGGPAAGTNPRALLDRIGTPVSGAWGSGRLITTAVASAIITSDGRLALGAVPQQVLVEALSR